MEHVTVKRTVVAEVHAEVHQVKKQRVEAKEPIYRVLLDELNGAVDGSSRAVLLDSLQAAMETHKEPIMVEHDYDKFVLSYLEKTTEKQLAERTTRLEAAEAALAASCTRKVTAEERLAASVEGEEECRKAVQAASGRAQEATFAQQKASATNESAQAALKSAEAELGMREEEFNDFQKTQSQLWSAKDPEMLTLEHAVTVVSLLPAEYPLSLQMGLKVALQQKPAERGTVALKAIEYAAQGVELRCEELQSQFEKATSEHAARKEEANGAQDDLEAATQQLEEATEDMQSKEQSLQEAVEELEAAQVDLSTCPAEIEKAEEAKGQADAARDLLAQIWEEFRSKFVIEGSPNPATPNGKNSVAAAQIPTPTKIEQTVTFIKDTIRKAA